MNTTQDIMRRLKDVIVMGQGSKAETASLLTDALAEIERLRQLVIDMRPYLDVDIDGGLQLGKPWVNHPEDGCPDCLWYAESLEWQRRIENGELDV